MGQEKNGKDISGKQGKANGKQGGKEGAGKEGKKKNSKSSTFVVLFLCVILSLAYSSMVATLGKAAFRTVEKNPELIGMAAAMSDVRLKKDVQHVHYGLRELTQLEPKSYKYINEDYNTTHHLGLMAQDLQEIMPELVVNIDNQISSDFRSELPEDIRQDSFYGIKYHELIPILINSIKELKTEVDQLKASSSIYS